MLAGTKIRKKIDPFVLFIIPNCRFSMYGGYDVRCKHSIVENSRKRPRSLSTLVIENFLLFLTSGRRALALAPMSLLTDANCIMCYSTSPTKTKFCPLHQNFNMIRYFALINALYIEIAIGS